MEHFILQLLFKLNNQEKFSMWLESIEVYTHRPIYTYRPIYSYLLLPALAFNKLQVECDWTLNSLLIEPIQVEYLYIHLTYRQLRTYICI